jgi:hypothetical protein
MISRRAFLKTFASAGAAAYFSRLLSPSLLHAATAPPLNVIFLTNDHGIALEYWRPRDPSGGNAAATGWTLDFAESQLAPLEKHKDSLVVIEGLDLACSPNILLSHTPGFASILSGWEAVSNDSGNRRPPAASIDQYLQSKLGTPAFLFSAGDTWPSFNDAGNPVAPFGRVTDAWQQWFGQFVPPAASPSQPDPKLVARAATQHRVVDYLNKRARTLRGRLAAAEQQKIDSHLAALALIESRIDQPALPVSAQCTKPAQGTNDPQSLSDHLLVNELVAQVLACGLTRVALVHMDGGRDTSRYPGVQPGLDAHQDVAHGYRPGVGEHLLVHEGGAADESTVVRLARMQNWYAGIVADLIDRLKAAGVYDNTLIVWTNELGNPCVHYTHDIPFVLAGGANTPFAKGRYLAFGAGTDPMLSPEEAAAGPTSMAHNHLLVSILQGLGLPDTHFGDPSFVGPLPGL